MGAASLSYIEEILSQEIFCSFILEMFLPPFMEHFLSHGSRCCVVSASVGFGALCIVVLFSLASFGFL